MLEETINTEALTKREYSKAFYMMLKVRLESLSGNEYQEFLEIVQIINKKIKKEEEVDF